MCTPRLLCFVLPAALAACQRERVSERALDGSSYWVYSPRHPDGTVLVHLHHSGDGASHVHDPDLQADLEATGMVGVFPMGGGEPGDDWNVGVNKDDIPRDDRAFLTALEVELRDSLSADTVWLSGFSKGGAMVYDVACLGESAYDGFLPMSGAFQDWIPEDCPSPARPVRHLQGSTDDRWPLHSADDPGSSHQGILESLAGLPAAQDGCMDQDPVEDGACQVWAGCVDEIRFCTFEGGHHEPAGFLLGHRAWIDHLEDGR